MPEVKLIAPEGGDRIVPILADHGLPDLVQHGAVIDVPAEVAGRGPRWRRITGDDDPLRRGAPGENGDHHERREHAGHDEVYDLGFGLLAQVGIWESADAPAAVPAEKKKEG